VKLNILISTYNERIHNLKQVVLSPRDDVEYIVTHQYTSDLHKPIPDELIRKDITVFQLNNKGVTKSRNNNLKLATGDIGLFSDDDVTYNHRYLDIVINTFRESPDIDVALFKIKTRDGEPEYKNYPLIPAKLQRLPFSVSTIEMAVNLKRIKTSGIRFDERFGAGQELLIGSEESIFVLDCIRHGLNVVTIPEYIVEHPYMSTINTIPVYHKKRNWVVGAYDCRINGPVALLKAFAGTIKYLPELIEHRTNPFAYFYHRLSAVIYILRTNKDFR
jgi:hypothetical protein